MYFELFLLVKYIRHKCFKKLLLSPNKAIISTDKPSVFLIFNVITFVGYFGVTILRNLRTVNLISVKVKNTVTTET